MIRHIFLYGTLLPEHAPAGLQPKLKELRFMASGELPGRLYDFGDYPGAILDEKGATSIKGGVFKLSRDSRVLSELDAYEEFDPSDPDQSLFVRQPHAVKLADGKVLPCWVYVYNQEPGDAPLIPDGDYANCRATTRSVVSRN